VSKIPTPAILPRGLNIRQASAYWGVSPNTFRKLVRLGLAPQPLRLPGLDRNIYGRAALDAAMSAKGPRRPLKAASAGEYISGEDSNDEPDDKPDSSTLEEGTMVVGINADLSAELEQIAVGEPVKLSERVPVIGVNQFCSKSRR
jgi:hypothetical protein